MLTLALAGVCGFSTPLCARTLYVDAKLGNDLNDGTKEANPLRSISRACELVRAGDEVLVARGVYLEHVRLDRRGTTERPIVFRAADPAKNAVVISGAAPGVRSGEKKWSLEDPTLQVYSVEITERPARVLYDDVDLFAYASLQELKDFKQQNGTPGPRHGHFYDAATRKLFVRLYPGGRYGSSDPADHIMKVAPATGEGGAGRHITDPKHYNFGVLPGGEANVVIDGFTFETPGVAGVFLRGSKVTIRNCWFLGCRSGVSGLTEEWDPERRTNDVTIERCDFSLLPTFDDVVDVMNAVQELSAEERQKLPLFYWWQRKQTEFTYELGIALKVGDRWTIRHNRIHQAFDGIGGWGFQKSVGADIYGNVFDHLVDNAIELENHSRDLRFHDNFIRDTFEPFSWQPLAGKPWPGPAWIYRNVVQDTDATKTLWTLLPWERGCFKILVEGQNWKVEAMKDERRDLIEVPPPGVIFSNNTIDFHDGNLFTIGRNPHEIISGIAFVNNLIVARNTVSKRVWKFHTKGMQFAGNYVRLLHPSDPVDVEKCSGNDGAPLPDSITELQTAAAGPAAKSLTGVSKYEGAVELTAYAGAIAPGKTYQIPEAGPAPAGGKAVSGKQ